MRKARGKYEWGWKSLRGPGEEKRALLIKHQRGSQVERKIQKRRGDHFCGRLTGKSQKDLYAMWGVTGNHSIYVTGIGRCGAGAQLLSDPIQCSNLSLVLRCQLPIQLLFIYLFLDGVLLCSPGWLEIHSVAYWIQELQMCAALPTYITSSSIVMWAILAICLLVDQKLPYSPRSHLWDVFVPCRESRTLWWRIAKKFCSVQFSYVCLWFPQN